jgi:fumarylacetoacetase
VSLAFGAWSRAGDRPRLGLPVPGGVVDLAAAAGAGAFGDEGDLLRGEHLDDLLTAGAAAWSRVVAAAARLAGAADFRLEADAGGIEWHLPFSVADYVDFYSSVEHATNLGRILRPGEAPLLPNWRHLPVGYHGRAGTVVVSGTEVRRPHGQALAAGASSPSFGPTAMLDFEVEIGFVTGAGPSPARPIAVEEAEAHVFGVVLVNDWSARDIQSWEYQPLGPFLGKSFLTSISPWVVPLSTLSPFRVPGPPQQPAPLPHLRAAEPRNVDLRLQVGLRTAAMASRDEPAAIVSAVSAAGLYWSSAQQLAHLTSNGARLRAGDLLASGTVSGSTPGSEGSLMELTWRGERPLALPGGERRGFLEDGDEVTISGWCGDGSERVDLGSVRGRVIA